MPKAKQDCEINAGTRWLQQWGARSAAWHTTVLGDDLYCHQPFCEQVLAQGCEFFLVCLPGSHTLLYEWVADFERNGDDALLVAWCELTTTEANGNVRYRNAWASSQPISEANVVAAVAAGRSRWKIENENNNTLKTKGYRFEHNYGHGKQHLAALLASLTLLAFLAHTILDRLDRHYRAVRQHLPSRRTFFEHLRALAQYLPFASWDALFDFMLKAPETAQPPPARCPNARKRQI